jgi:hypothetical protein
LKAARAERDYGRREEGERAVVVRNDATIWESASNDSPFHFGEHVTVSAWRRLWTLGDRAILGRPLLGLFCSSQCPGDVILRESGDSFRFC